MTKKKVVTLLPNQGWLIGQQKELHKSKLLEYITKLKHNCKNHVLFPNVHLEFSMLHISQVLENCAYLFSVLDIHNCVEIWRTEYPQQILTILSDVFNDIDTDDLDSIIGSDWADVRDDSNVNLSPNDTANLSDIGMAMQVLDQSSDEHINISVILSAFAEETSCNVHTEAMDTSL